VRGAASRWLRRWLRQPGGVPGKAIVCTTSGVLWIAIMALTFGARYNEAANFVKGGCGGKWVLAREDIHSTR
jgi:hypothetical protein